MRISQITNFRQTAEGIHVLLELEKKTNHRNLLTTNHKVPFPTIGRPPFNLTISPSSDKIKSQGSISISSFNCLREIFPVVFGPSLHHILRTLCPPQGAAEKRRQPHYPFAAPLPLYKPHKREGPSSFKTGHFISLSTSISPSLSLLS